MNITTHLIIISIRTDGIAALSYWHDIYTLVFTQFHLPVILRHTSDNIVVCECPSTSHKTVFYPQISVLLCNLYLCNGILNKHCRVWFTRMVHYATLVIDEILNSQSGRKQLVTGTKMIKLATGQRQHCHTQTVYICIRDGRVCAQSTSKFAVHIIIDDITATHGMPHENIHSPVAKHPDTNIRKIEIIIKQRSKSLNRRFL